jgi:outer membrane immunogenic protein
MRAILSAFVTLAACATALPAVAADIPMKAPIQPAIAAPAFNWTGFYVGIHGGYSRGDLTSDTDATINHEPNGFILGGQAGANWQWTWLVLGAEADLSYTNIKGSDATTFGPFIANVSSKYEYFGTVRGRAGVAFDRFLVYGTGGYAYSRADGSVQVTLAGLPVVAGTDKVNLSGWTAGGGVEGAITNNVTARVEYLYVDFGKSSTAINLGFAFTDTFNTTAHILRGGLNYKF